MTEHAAPSADALALGALIGRLLPKGFARRSDDGVDIDVPLLVDALRQDGWRRVPEHRDISVLGEPSMGSCGQPGCLFRKLT